MIQVVNMELLIPQVMMINNVKRGIKMTFSKRIKNEMTFKLKDKTAQALPEFALCLPIVVLVCGILITVCQLVFAKQVIQTAAFAGCRAYVKDGYTSETRAKAEAKDHAELTVKYAGMKVTLDDVICVTSPLVELTGAETRTGISPYRVGECFTIGYVNLLFPVYWQNEQLMPNITQIDGYCAMVMETNRGASTP